MGAPAPRAPDLTVTESAASDLVTIDEPDVAVRGISAGQVGLDDSEPGGAAAVGAAIPQPPEQLARAATETPGRDWVPMAAAVLAVLLLVVPWLVQAARRLPVER